MCGRSLILRVFLFLLSALLLWCISYHSHESCDKKHIPLGTFGTAKTPLVGPSSVEPAASAGLEIGEAGPEDASVVPWQDMSTCNLVSTKPLLH